MINLLNQVSVAVLLDCFVSARLESKREKEEQLVDEKTDRGTLRRLPSQNSNHTPDASYFMLDVYCRMENCTRCAV